MATLTLCFIELKIEFYYLVVLYILEEMDL